MEDRPASRHARITHIHGTRTIVNTAPVGDAGCVQEVQAARDINRDVSAAPIPMEFVVVVCRERVPQIAALQGQRHHSDGRIVVDD